MDLDKYLNLWKLDSADKIASTHTSEVYKAYRSEVPFVLKILNDKGKIHEKDGSIALKFFAGNGTVRLIDASDEAQLLEYVDGEKLSVLVKAGHDTLASEIICKILAQLHANNLSYPTELRNLERQFKSLLNRGHKAPKDSIFYKSLRIAEELLGTEDSKCILHGDIHHDNILHSSSRGWLAIDPQPLMGERLYDFANCFFNPDDCSSVVEDMRRIKDTAKIFAHATGSDSTRILKFAYAHGGLSMSWQLDDGQQPTRRLRISKILETILKV